MVRNRAGYLIYSYLLMRSLSLSLSLSLGLRSSREGIRREYGGSLEYPRGLSLYS
jgi:hypothetical protein